ncbi:hypothetical protein IWZ03DRAFT_195342 [Phyllosticta citriasiana]|uniref:Uncharacterized protein n=1 Tax=Phyllosticta citriasiana TaxID=595635 RepID=A0ABR1KQQ0_9PEZI
MLEACSSPSSSRRQPNTHPSPLYPLSPTLDSRHRLPNTAICRRRPQSWPPHWAPAARLSPLHDSLLTCARPTYAVRGPGNGCAVAPGYSAHLLRAEMQAGGGALFFYFFIFIFILNGKRQHPTRLTSIHEAPVPVPTTTSRRTCSQCSPPELKSSHSTCTSSTYNSRLLFASQEALPAVTARPKFLQFSCRGHVSQRISPPFQRLTNQV